MTQHQFQSTPNLLHPLDFLPKALHQRPEQYLSKDEDDLCWYVTTFFQSKTIPYFFVRCFLIEKEGFVNYTHMYGAKQIKITKHKYLLEPRRGSQQLTDVQPEMVASHKVSRFWILAAFLKSEN